MHGQRQRQNNAHITTAKEKSGSRSSSSVIITGGDGGGGGGDKQRIVENSIERITTDSFCVLKWFVGNEMNLRKFNVHTQTHRHTNTPIQETQLQTFSLI